MTMLRPFIALAAAASLSAIASAQTAPPEEHATPFLPVTNEPPAELRVDPPLAGPLANRGVAIIRYRTKHFRILPVFGAGAADVSPRAGHLHVGIDGLPWRLADAGGTDAIVLTGLPPGSHTVRIELATPEHRVLTGRTVTFVVPAHRDEPLQPHQITGEHP
jgi:hypothetical protein